MKMLACALVLISSVAVARRVQLFLRSPSSMTGHYDRLLRYPVRQWRWLVLVVLTTIAFSGTTALAPWPMKLLVDNCLAHRRANVVVVAAVGSFGRFLLNSILHFGVTRRRTPAGHCMVH